MAAIRRILAGVLVLATSLLVACSNSGRSSTTTSSQALSIALNPPPNTSTIPVGSTTGITFTPVVSNDPGASGVDWAVTCTNPAPQAAPCGTLSIPTLHSASGTAATYLPPSVLPGGSLTVNVTVFASADHTKNVTTAVLVTSYVSVLKGTYVFEVRGADSSAFPYESAGALVFDGNGNITSGVETLNTVAGFSTAYTVQSSTGVASTGVASSYFIGPDGRGTITLNLQQTNISTNTLQQTFSLVVISSSQALIAELDTNTGNTAAGTLELQDPTAATAALTGAYAFVTSGTDSASVTNPLGGSPAATAMGGVLNIDNNPSPGSISGHGSLADQDYYNSTATRQLLSCTSPTGVKGSVSPPGSLGTVTITLTGSSCFGTTFPASIQFTGYIVDASHVRLIESDDTNGTGGFLTAGIAINQGAAAGTFTAASLSGSYVFDALGIDLNYGAPASFTSAGVLSANGSGGLSGITDIFFPGDAIGFPANPLTGTYAVDANHIGRTNLRLTFKGAVPPAPTPTFLFYLTGSGTPPLVLYAGGADLSFPAIGVGFAYPQAANASALSFGNPESYGVRLTQQNGSENDGTGQMTATASSVSGTLKGSIDDFTGGSLFTGTSVSLLDSFTLPADKYGRISGTFMNIAGSAGPFVEYYLVDNNHGFLIETDMATTNSVALGYFAQACDVTSANGCQMAASGFPAEYSLKGRSIPAVRKTK